MFCCDKTWKISELSSGIDCGHGFCCNINGRNSSPKGVIGMYDKGICNKLRKITTIILLIISKYATHFCGKIDCLAQYGTGSNPSIIIFIIFTEIGGGTFSNSGGRNSQHNLPSAAKGAHKCCENT